MTTRFLFLASQLQPFLVSGISRLLMLYPEVQVLLLCDRADENTPVQPVFQERLQVFSFSHVPDPFFLDHITAFRPDVVFCAGWMYPRYLGWCSQLRKNGAITICAMDTQWKGSWKQQLARIIAPVTLKRYFSLAWVPGRRQYDYALKLGFRREQVYDHLYAPDTALFAQAWNRSGNNKKTAFPKVLLYAGRLVPHKLQPLLTAFCSLKSEERGNWQLCIAGNGPMAKHPLLSAPAVKHISFLSQRQLMELMAAAGACALCSTDEAWGTIIQEAAAAGMPLVLSAQCGASDDFLEAGVNGFLCDGRDQKSIRQALLRLMGCNDATLFQMAAASHRLGMRSGTDTWVATLMAMSGK